MGIDWVLVAELLVLGCASGFLAGLLGIGGMLLVPALTFLASVQGFATDAARSGGTW
ncbi:MAG: putative rane transporter protein [Polaromonas sp.]|nr:putative rane transporter protein [Polaromonas sp.]MDB5844844.1 putative rane transporter protein [Polaromonas sp.]